MASTEPSAEKDEVKDSSPNWLGQFWRSLIPTNVWDRAPAAITSWGYSSLAFLFVVAVAASIAKANLGSFVITMVLVFGLFVALWAFSRMSQSREAFWKNFGKVAGATTIASIIALFCTILLYIAVGVPVWLDRFFQPGYSVRTPSGVSVRPGASLRDLPFGRSDRSASGAKASRSESAFAFITTATAQGAVRITADAITQDPRTSLTVIWDRNLPLGYSIEIAIKPRDAAGEFPDAVSIPADRGVAHITGLQSGTIYEVRVVSEERRRRSEPVIKTVATNADQLVLAPFTGFRRVYSGKLSPEGKPDGIDGEMVFSRDPEPSGGEPRRWVLRGGHKDGALHGSATLSTDPFECHAPECGSRCDLSFQDGEIASGRCDLTTASLSARAAARAKRAVLYGLPSHYVGGVTGVSKGRTASVRFGPFLLWFSGDGVLEGHDPNVTDLYRGHWTEGVFDRGSLIGTNGGILETGQEYAQERCLLAITPMKDGGISGFGGRLTCTGIELGEWRDGTTPFRGFDTSFADHLISSFWYNRGVRQRLQSAENDRFEPCKPEETWGLPQAAGEPDSPDWQLSCDRNDGPFECALKSAAAGLTIIGRKPINAVPGIEYMTSATARGTATRIRIDGKERTLGSASKQLPASNLSIAAELCSGSVLQDSDGHEVSLNGFCPKLALMFNRLLACSKPQGALPDNVHEPDPAQFDAANFIKTSFPDYGAVHFNAVRLNERFYTSFDLVAKYTIDIEFGDACERRHHLEIPGEARGYGYNFGADLSTGRWPPTVLSVEPHDVGKWLQEAIVKPGFTRDAYTCLRSFVKYEWLVKFSFQYRGRSGETYFRVAFRDTPLKEDDVTPATRQDFDSLKALQAKTQKDPGSPGDFARELDASGFPTTWRGRL